MLYGCLASSAARARVRGSDDPSFMAPHDADITSRRAPMIDEMDAWWRITQSPMDRVAHIPTCTDVADVSAGAARAPACRTYATARRRPWHSAETPDDAGAWTSNGTGRVGLGPATGYRGHRRDASRRMITTCNTAMMRAAFLL